MPQSLNVAATLATQKLAVPNTPPAATIAVQARARAERVRHAIFDGATHGFQQRVCSEMAWRRERHSREQNGHDRLTVELVFADVLVHEADGNQDTAAAILAAFQRQLSPVIRLRDGQFLLEFE